MKTADIPTKQPSLWIPERNIGTLAILGKTAEECAELGAKLARCMIQGVEGADPETGEPNLEALQDEIADVNAMLFLLHERLGLDAGAMRERCLRKIAFKRPWLEGLDDLGKAAP